VLDTVILHSAADADRARELASAWTSRRAIACQVGAPQTHLSFGRHIALFALWSPATGEQGEEVAGLVSAVAAHTRRAALLVCDTAEPPQSAVDAELVMVFTSDVLVDLAKLDRLARKLEKGCVVASEYVKKPEAKRTAGMASARTNQWRRHKEAEIAARQLKQTKPLDYGALRRASRIGFVIGAVVGIVLVMGVLGPWAASLGN
jgi:hypothetical protein